MSKEFNQEKIVPKEKKRGSFRLIGVVIPNLENPNRILGYVLLDVKNYRIIPVIPEQFNTMIKHYTFENVRWNTVLGVIESTESNVKDYTKKLMKFDNKGKVIGNQGYIVLAKVIAGDEVGYKILDYNLRIVDVKEEILIKTVQNNKVPILNAKIVEGTYISALKDSFPKIYKEKKAKVFSRAQTKEAHERHLEKIVYRFKKSVIDRSTFINFGVSDYFPNEDNDEKAYLKFKKNLKIYTKEIASIHHPTIVEKANKIYNIGYENEEYDKYIAILITCMYIDTFITKKYEILRPFVGIGKDWTGFQLENEKLYELLKSTKHTDLVHMLEVIKGEERFLRKTKTKLGIDGKTLVDKSYFPRARTTQAYRIEILNDYNKCKEEGTENVVETIYNIYNNISNPEIKRYLSLLPICETLSRVKSKKQLVEIKLNMRTQKGIRNIGYTILEKEAGTISEDNILYSRSPLRYVFENGYISKAEAKEIMSKSTCFGDMYFANKLAKIRKEGLYGLGKQVDNIYQRYYTKFTELDITQLAIESIMIILAVYNLDLALYLNKKHKYVDIDLDSVGHEEFPLTDKDKIYYQTGGKYNQSVLLKNKSWSGLSTMPMGLRTAIALNATNSVPLELEDLLNYLYC